MLSEFESLTIGVGLSVVTIIIGIIAEIKVILKLNTFLTLLQNRSINISTDKSRNDEEDNIEEQSFDSDETFRFKTQLNEL